MEARPCHTGPRATPSLAMDTFPLQQGTLPWLAGLMRWSSGEHLNVGDDLGRVAMDVVVRTLFGSARSVQPGRAVDAAAQTLPPGVRPWGGCSHSVPRAPPRGSCSTGVYAWRA